MAKVTIEEAYIPREAGTRWAVVIQSTGPLAYFLDRKEAEEFARDAGEILVDLQLAEAQA
jgi:hypothetical protein